MENKDLIAKIALKTNANINDIEKILQDKKLEKILKILTNEEISQNYLETNDISELIFTLLYDEKIRQDAKGISDEFWDNSVKKGLKVYTDLLVNTPFTEDTEDKLIARYQTQSDNEIPFLIYQKKYEKVFTK